MICIFSLSLANEFLCRIRIVSGHTGHFLLPRAIHVEFLRILSSHRSVLTQNSCHIAIRSIWVNHRPRFVLLMVEHCHFVTLGLVLDVLVATSSSTSNASVRTVESVPWTEGPQLSVGRFLQTEPVALLDGA